MRAGLDGPARLPVQTVLRAEGRHYAGRLAAGTLRPGDEVVVLPAGTRSTVTAVELPAGPTLAFLLMTSLTTLGITGYLVLRMRDALALAELASALQAWQLHQVFARRPASDRPPPPT